MDTATSGIELLHAEIEALAVQVAKHVDAVAAAFAAGECQAELHLSGQTLKALAARFLVDADGVAGWQLMKVSKKRGRQ
jgi:hypothetical protein